MSIFNSLNEKLQNNGFSSSSNSGTVLTVLNFSAPGSATQYAVFRISMQAGLQVRNADSAFNATLQ
jgi:hypothetical protein